jgi:hypothetical protein
MSIVQVVPLHTNHNFCQIDPLYKCRNKMKDSLPCVEVGALVGAQNNGLTSSLQEILLAGWSSGGRSGRQACVEPVGPLVRQAETFTSVTDSDFFGVTGSSFSGATSSGFSGAMAGRSRELPGG